MARCKNRRGSWAALAISALLYVQARAQDPAAASGPIPPDLDPQTLQQRGAVIGAVNIRIDNVFDLSAAGEDKPLYRWANRVHVRTRPRAVQDVLLFKPGDPFQARLLEESARSLRTRNFIAEATVQPQSYDAATNTAVVDVWVRDAWSLEPDIKFSRSGGETEYGIGISEDNLFGRGKSLAASFSSDVDRDEALIGYSDRNVKGTRTRLDVGFANTSDGDRIRLDAGRPFYAFDTRWSIAGNLLDDERIDSIYDVGEVIDEFKHETRFVSIQGGLSRGLIDGKAKRWFAGFTYEEDEFFPTSEMPQPLLLPENRKLAYPWIGWQFIAEDFRQTSELNAMGRIEDISLGLDMFINVGMATEAFGSDRRATIVTAGARKGWEPGGSGRLLLLEATAEARDERDGVHNSVISTRARYYHRNFGRQLFSASLTTVFANKLDAENQVLLGGDNGLRGYPLRYQSGERSTIVTIEQRFFTDWYPFRLLRVGYALFMDAGRVWGTDSRGTPHLGNLYDVGVGLRLTSPRASSGSVIHIDLAFPLNGDQSIDNVQLIIEKKSSF
jgi:outer membrane protein assembly factor BamA